jgi:hypothetical protein
MSSPDPAGEQARLESVAVEATADHAGYRLIAGARLKQFAADYYAPPMSAVPAIGEAAVVGLDRRVNGGPPPDLSEWRTLHLELGGVCQATEEHTRRVISAYFDPERAEALVRIGLSEPASWSLDWAQIVDGLGEAQALDLCIATHHDGRFCVQHVHFVVAPMWLVSLWQPACAHDQALAGAGFPLPGSRVREQFTVVDVVGSAGSDHLARAVQDVVRHNEYQSEVLSVLIEEWELRFFRAFAAEALDVRDQELRALQDEISTLREFLSSVHLANKTVWRRAQNQPAFPLKVKDEAVVRCRELEAVLHERRADLRDAFALLAGAAADQQARAAADTEKRMQSLAALATYATGLVLVPGLVVGLYGADVLGVPGKGHTVGLWYLLGISILAALITIGIFERARRSRR